MSDPIVPIKHTLTQQQHVSAVPIPSIVLAIEEQGERRVIKYTEIQMDYSFSSVFMVSGADLKRNVILFPSPPL